jgi:hypothetical protein
MDDTAQLLVGIAIGLAIYFSVMGTIYYFVGRPRP